MQLRIKALHLRVAGMLAAALIATSSCSVTTCTFSKDIGCYVDGGDAARILNTTASHSSDENSLEWCASQCSVLGFADGDMVGVEYGNQCFCGKALAPGHEHPHVAPATECEVIKCPGSHALPGEKPEYCGDANRVRVYTAKCIDSRNTPNYMPCLAEPTKSTKFCDSTLPTAERVEDILGRLEQSDLCAMLNDKMAPIPHTNFSGYNWNTECLHGLGATCLTQDGVTRCPTIFGAPPGLGSAFNRTVANNLGLTIGDEIRAFGNANGHRGYQNRPIGVSAWGPSLNVYRDPRWGRNVEVPTEDPFHSGSYGVAYTNGLQWGSVSKPHTTDPLPHGFTKRYTKAIGALKHYAIYNVEAGRGSTYFAIASHDIEDTYLPGFHATVEDAGSLGYMCSYAALTNAELIPSSAEAKYPHSEPACASKFFAQRKMITEWGFEGYVQSDCGAVNNLWSQEKWAVNKTDAAARALKDGMMNSNCGGGLVDHICAAVDEGLADIADLKARVARTFTLLIEAGLFDPLAGNPYTSIPFDTINSAEAQERSLDAARQSLVLLRNPAVAASAGAAVLPIPPSATHKIALIGPHARTQKDLAGNYFEGIGVGTCAGPGCITTLEAALNALAPSNVTTVLGCTDPKDPSGASRTCASLPALQVRTAVAAANAAEHVVFALGIDGSIEGEGHDRMDITLPANQLVLLNAVLEKIGTTKPVTLLLFNGGTIALPEMLLTAPNLAIVECWYPGASGGTSIAEALFGVTNRWGKLPVTYYNTAFTAASPFTNMNMTATATSPGRSYKYLRNATLASFPFGFGLSYTTFTVERESPAIVQLKGSDARANVTFRVTNTGSIAGDEVVFLFLNSSSAAARERQRGLLSPAADPMAIKQLVGYERVHLAAGVSTTVSFEVSAKAALTTVDGRGTRHALAGEHELFASRGHGEVAVVKVVLDLNGARRRVISTMEGLY